MPPAAAVAVAATPPSPAVWVPWEVGVVASSLQKGPTLSLQPRAEVEASSRHRGCLRRPCSCRSRGRGQPRHLCCGALVQPHRCLRATSHSWHRLRPLCPVGLVRHSNNRMRNRDTCVPIRARREGTSQPSRAHVPYVGGGHCTFVRCVCVCVCVCGAKTLALTRSAECCILSHGAPDAPSPSRRTTQRRTARVTARTTPPRRPCRRSPPQT